MNPQIHNPDDVSSDDINLLDLWHTLVRRRYFILQVTCAVAVLTVLITLLLWDRYDSQTVLIPLTQGNQSSALSSLSGLTGLLGVGASEDPQARLLAILGSRTLAKDVIDHLDLSHIFFIDQWDFYKQRWLNEPPPTFEDALKMLKDIATITPDKTNNTIAIKVRHPDSVLAAAIANQYIEILKTILQDNTYSLAKKNRIFLAAQAEQTFSRVVKAEKALQQFETEYDVIALDTQTRVAVEALASLEGQIIAKEVQIGVVQRAMTGANQEVYLLQEELKGLRMQLDKLKRGAPQISPPSGDSPRETQTFISFDKAPEIKFQYSQLQREVILQNKIFALLVEQLEQAKIAEAKDETTFQLLDVAIPSEEKASPKRSIIIVIVTILAMLSGSFLALILDSINPKVHSEEQLKRYAGLHFLSTIPLYSSPKSSLRQEKTRTNKIQAPLSLPAPAIESFHYLYMQLKYLYPEKTKPLMILFTGESAEELLTILINVGIVAAQAGEHTLLIESDLHHPTLHTMFQRALSPGLIDIFSSEHCQSLANFIQETAIRNLHIISAGATNQEDQYFSFDSKNFEGFIAECRVNYDLILCAAPSITTSIDAIVLSNIADIICLLITRDVTCLDDLRRAYEILSKTKTIKIGSILLGRNNKKYSSKEKIASSTSNRGSHTSAQSGA